MKPVAMCLAAIMVSGCVLAEDDERVKGSGNVVTESRSVEGFDGVDVCCAIKASITQGDSEGLSVTTDDNIVSDVLTTVSNGTLMVRLDSSRSYQPTGDIEVTIEVVDLSRLRISGAANVETGEITASAFSINAATGLLKTAVVADSLQVDADDAARVEISGTVDSQTIALDDASSLEAGDLGSRVADITADNASSAKVWVAEELTVDLRNASSVEYYGSPTVDEQQVSGASTLLPLGEKTE